jgi:hypothetical protein
MAKTAEDVEGYEADWLAMDRDGFVALMSTAGGGYPPEEFLRDTAAHASAIEVILAANPTTNAIQAPALDPEYVNTWKLMAERGLFAFDTDANGGPYLKVAKPRVPVRVDALPRKARDVVSRLPLALRFADVSTITREMIEGQR